MGGICTFLSQCSWETSEHGHSLSEYEVVLRKIESSIEAESIIQMLPEALQKRVFPLGVNILFLTLLLLENGTLKTP